MHDCPPSTLQSSPFLCSSVTRSLDEVSRTMHNDISKPLCEFDRHGTSILWFGNKESVPDPFSELETGSIQEVIGDPCDKEVEHQTEDKGRNDNVPVRVAERVEVEDEVRHQSVQSEELHQIETVGNLAEPDKDTPGGKPLHGVRDFDPAGRASRKQRVSVSSCACESRVRRRACVRTHMRMQTAGIQFDINMY